MITDTYKAVDAKARRDRDRTTLKAACPFCGNEATAIENAIGVLAVSASSHCDHLMNIRNGGLRGFEFVFMARETQVQAGADLVNNEVEENKRIVEGQQSMDSFMGA